eukprot:TRINITY_DN21939_c0_g1_i1.p1 TRINITY_DN21939_c0_g1~~TRINITY_DN21939_c0_g1_i1.p1  ORF type:complete len:487 (-),score=86.98 TRINITY_DN21939_c0_g1_i1:91-1551(-)
MGSQFASCSNECEGCRGENLCTRSGCSALCMVRKEQKASMKTITFTVDGGHAPAPERYAPHGADVQLFHNACSGLFTHEKVLESLPREPRGSDLENIGPRKSMEELQDECRYNAGKLQKIKQLASKYQAWRPVRGDGNCFYRTVIFGTVEAALAAGNQQWMKKLMTLLQDVVYETHPETAAHKQMLQIMQTWRCPEQAEQWLAHDAKLDEALVRASRQLVRMFLLRRAHDPTPSGMTYEQLACALDSSCSSIEDFCRSVVDPLGRDAETLALDALPQQLGIGIRMWVLDRRDEVDLVSLDTPGPEGDIDVHVLFKPGHYDLLYPAAEAASSSALSGKAILSEDSCTSKNATNGDLLDPAKPVLSEESCAAGTAMQGHDPERAVLPVGGCTAREAAEGGLLDPAKDVLPEESSAAGKATQGDLLDPAKDVLPEQSHISKQDIEGDLPYAAKLSCLEKSVMRGRPWKVTCSIQPHPCYQREVVIRERP